MPKKRTTDIRLISTETFRDSDGLSVFSEVPAFGIDESTSVTAYDERSVRSLRASVGATSEASCERVLRGVPRSFSLDVERSASERIHYQMNLESDLDLQMDVSANAGTTRR